MTPNVERIIAAISYVIDEARERGYRVTQYDISKSLFLADRSHLNKFGRPVTFDNYVAMENGPVPSLSYDFLKEDAGAIRRYRVAIPWTRTPAPDISPRAYSYEISKTQVITDALSPSDLDELRAAIIVVKSLGFQQVRRLTHDDQAYIEAWDGEAEAKNNHMSLSLMFDVPNEEAAKELAFLSKHL